jgi:anti-sigma-K factor RskA
MMRYLKPELLEHLAGAYVLGTLSGRARQRFVRLMQAHPTIEQAVQKWEKRLLPLASSVPPATPPKRVWKAINTRLEPAPHNDRFAGFAFWRMSAPLALGVLLGVGVIQFLPKDEGVPESYVGFLTGTPGAAPTVHASAMRKEAVLFIKMIEPVTLVPGQHLVLWGLSKDNPPKRIGVIPAASGKSRMTLAAPADATFKGITTLAVSIENDGAENSAAPIGEIVRQGPCVKLW